MEAKETACLVEEERHEVDAGVGWQGEGKSTAVTP